MPMRWITAVGILLCASPSWAEGVTLAEYLDQVREQFQQAKASSIEKNKTPLHIDKISVELVVRHATQADGRLELFVLEEDADASADRTQKFLFDVFLDESAARAKLAPGTEQPEAGPIPPSRSAPSESGAASADSAGTPLATTVAGASVTDDIDQLRSNTQTIATTVNRLQTQIRALQAEQTRLMSRITTLEARKLSR